MGLEDHQLAIYELAYREGFRTLEDQTRRIDQFRGQALTMFGIATAATGVLAGVVLGAPDSDRDSWMWVPIILGAVIYLGVVECLRRVVRPNVEWRLYLSPKDIVEGYADHETPATIGETHRTLALRLEENIDHNESGIDRLRRSFNLALTGLVIDIAWWAVLAGLVV